MTRAAEGFDHGSSVVTEALRMPNAGVPSDDEVFELMEGEIAPMQAKSHVRESNKSGLTIAVAHALPLNVCDSA